MGEFLRLWFSLFYLLIVVPLIALGRVVLALLEAIIQEVG